MNISYSDKEIIDGILLGNKKTHDDALNYVYKTYYPLIRNFILNNNGDDEDAADIFQEAIIILYNQIKEDKFRGDSTVKTYIYAIARNLWLKELRKHPHQLSDIADTENFSAVIKEEEVDEADSEQKGTILRKLINQLGSGCKDILIDYYYARHSMKEIMIKFGLGSEQAAKNKKYRCMKRLIELCKQNGLHKS